MAKTIDENVTFRSRLEGFKIGEQRIFPFQTVKAMRSAKVNAYQFSQENGIKFIISQDPKACTLSVTRTA